VETTRRIAGHRRVGPRRRRRALVIAAGLVGAVALSSGSGAQASTPTVTFSGACLLGLANIVTPSTSAVSTGAGGSVTVVNNASGSIAVQSNGDTKTIKPKASADFAYPLNDAVRSYTIKAGCGLVNLSGSVKVTVAANPPAPKPDPEPGTGAPAPGQGGGSDPAPGTGSGPGTGPGSGSGPGTAPGGGSVVPGVPAAGAFPAGFANPPVALSAPGAGNLPIPDVQAGVPGAPAEAVPPAVDLLNSGSDPATGAQPAIRSVAQSKTGAPSMHMLLILVATVLFLGVGAAAVRAVRATRPTGVALAARA
jgi:hypothetical protein